ncbi:hypothetical protein M427DRAFT_67972 [Gonapodya prolifera JEL478]|uniref:F-box domain-containing protein n=1 Tax=Gonapodya prolifera (strain JEL478) TaxID=1344416 RepID=A0A139AN72_GONPJ|nr:hypothetical protein M427DRAFT_67972 [Gonapodya prolifera JEL478]|eukprot:KXS18158.1 hypothetical protein M427DRAFT_67972 [Gonapodya prolifera JEL478]
MVALPPELWNLVIHALTDHPRTLLALTRTCRQFNGPAEAALYRSISPRDSSSLHQLCQCLRKAHQKRRVISLNLSAMGHYLRPEYLEDILAFLHLPSVLSLKLPFTTDSKPAQLMVELVSECLNVRTLSLPWIGDTFDHQPDIKHNLALISCLHNTPRVQNLRLGCVSDGVGSVFADIVGGLKDLGRLEMTEYCEVGKEEVQALAAAPGKLASIRIGPFRGEDLSSLHALLLNHRHTLREVMIVDEGVYPPGLLTLLVDNLPYLTKLALFTGRIPTAELDVFFQQVSGLECCVIQSQPGIADRHLRSLLARNPGLTALGLSHSSITDVSLIPLLERIGPHLVTLDLESCALISDVSLSVMSTSCSSLRELDLGGRHPLVTMDGLRGLLDENSVCRPTLKHIGATGIRCSRYYGTGEELRSWVSKVTKEFGGMSDMIWRSFTCRKYGDLAQTDYEF